MRIAICGSPDFDDYDLLEKKCDAITSKLREIVVLTIVQGTLQHDAERTARKWATKRKYVMRNFHVDGRDKQGEAKAIAEMLDEAQLIICFGESEGITEPAEDRGIAIRRIKI